ncbi:hypothetical protein ACFL3T_00065 [Patescibacteria group bacterium]
MANGSVGFTNHIHPHQIPQMVAHRGMKGDDMAKQVKQVQDIRKEIWPDHQEFFADLVWHYFLRWVLMLLIGASFFTIEVGSRFHLGFIGFLIAVGNFGEINSKYRFDRINVVFLLLALAFFTTCSFILPFIR